MSLVGLITKYRWCMNSSSITGLLLVIAAILGVWVLIPAWTKRGQEVEIIREAKNEQRQQIREVRQKVGRPSKQISVAHASIRLSQLRLIFGFTMLAGFLTGVIALADAVHLWALSVAGFATAAGSIVITRNATAKHQLLLQGSLASRSRNTSAAFSAHVESTPMAAEEPQAEAPTWTPIELPKPMHAGHVGNLEQPVLAQVTPLWLETEVVEEAPVAELNIDEILRKRRNVG